MKLVLSLLCLMFISCSSPEKKREPTPAAPAYAEILRQAKNETARKDYLAATKKLNKVVTEVPESDLAAEARMGLGDIFFAQGRWQEAADSYLKVVSGPTRSPLEAWAGMRAGQALAQLDRPSDALTPLDSALRLGTLTPEQTITALRLRLSLLKRLNSPLEELKTLLHLHSTLPTPQEKQEVQLQATALVESRLMPEQLEEVANDSKFSLVQPVAQFRAGLSAFERADFGRARNFLSATISSAPQGELAERSQDLITQIDARERVNPRRVGVILPLSGKLQKVGYRALRGIQLGLGIYGKSRSGIELAVIDSAGNASKARRAVEKLVIDDNVGVIIGSLSSKEASAVSSKAQEFGVPSIALSQKSGLTAIGPFVFRNALTSEMQVRELVNEAMKIRGLKNFAILYPKDAYGVEFANLFWDEVVRQGGQIRGAQSYTPGETDFNGPIKRLVGTYEADARKWEFKLRYEEWKKNRPAHLRRDEPQDILPPILDFDAIFIPDSAKALGQIAPTLLYNDVKDVPLLGTNLWNTPLLIERAGKFLKNPIFVDSFLSTDPAIQNSAFYKEFVATFGTPPEEFELVAYDSGVMLRRILEAGASNRADIQVALSKINQMAGGFSLMTMTEAREVQRPLVVLTVQENQIVRALDVPTKQ